MHVSITNRRNFIKKMAVLSAMTAAATMFPGIVFANEQEKGVPEGEDLDWKKGPCRFCGVGCGILVGTQNGRAVAVKGDPNSSVNKGLLCVKGYHQIMCIQAKDRLTHALVKKHGKYVKTPVSEALDIVANKMKETIKIYGKDAVAMYTSGQSTIPEGYVASKLMKGAIGTNNLDCNARLCMASAVTGFLTSFGADEPMGCYEDIEHADYFVTWGNNMAEMHPVLFSRMLAQKNKKGAKIVDLATRTTRSSSAANKSILFEPQTDLAIANAICYEIVHNGWVNSKFVEEHVNFKKGLTNMGYGLEDKYKFKDTPSTISFQDYKIFLEDYAPEKVEKYAKISAKDIKYLAAIYGDPNKKVVSFWCMGMNQHTRGTWMNNLVYNIHLLTGKISAPGNGPFSLTGQPSACGTAREVGTFTHKLPHGVVMNEKDRRMAAKIWKVPYERIPSKPTYHATEMFRAIDRGDIKFIWTQATNPLVSLPKTSRYRPAMKKKSCFVVVSEVFPTPTSDVADVILPAKWHIEKGGLYGNSERRTQYWKPMVAGPGETTEDAWMFIEVAKRMGYGNLFPYTKEGHVEEIYNEYRQFHAGKKHNMAPLEVLEKESGAIWPYVNGKSTQWRYNSKYDPACENGKDFHFYGKKDGKAIIWQRPYESAPEMPNKEYPFWLNTGRVIEHWHTGSMTRRIPILHKAVPNAYVELHPKDAKQLGLHNGEKARVTSRRGTCILPVSINERGLPTEGQVFVPFFDENMMINDVTLDAFCPISKEPDYKKCAVKIEKV
ncbi:periplasmic nitrate reductase subunit alpha [Tenacibaculum maritimum]|uniref:Nitrate reductase n=2 Tax=Tenacibaculum maritimum TaxID=107401 RepID=A0A2H1E9N3_9FLAO|nr:periplasmic nitrate reductase subunit alpha [Tenacibaculum maritimum]QCD62250.1 periplasmic nitrate reductase subunit alpha [Tenacibaculum maritimum]CAA0149056.1 periplasmic nitrate reductase, large subunit [Tenacibaculum maritimum]CAA0193403.1 periplasmic nitrate reductase, large subunit [Tenacibaculum maritimum]SFZ82676.1 periplasmic nitrate reductase, large subunit [Tenacibaculum maritimum NCIMB 2154]